MRLELQFMTLLNNHIELERQAAVSTKNSDTTISRYDDSFTVPYRVRSGIPSMISFDFDTVCIDFVR